MAPAVAVMLLILGYPLLRLLEVSFQQYGLRQLLTGESQWVGFKNYSTILSDSFFWQVTFRTVAFTTVNVALTIGIGLALAQLMNRISHWARLVLTTVLVFVWATPGIVAITVWLWLVDYQYGIVNKLFGLGHHSWFDNPWSGFGVITAVVVWGALPFVTITLHAAISQVPSELLEAAHIDGASGPQAFRNVTLPAIGPVLTLLTLLSVIWDFQVFNQVWVMNGNQPSQSYYLLGVYSYTQSFGSSSYGTGAAMAVVMVLMLMGASMVYVRRMAQAGEVT
ncbi:sugar ABC transporter permease [Streptomyces sp. H51]|uniref:carbohydrate ABC transporter permease n=1 Tax=Streptomyces sp. H51 TaxID=3111770 RepID=UPI002D76E5BC|nr:sugar ABC transporter permease [Streptomyces sp. H51]